MVFVFNYIGYYVMFWDWINYLEEVICYGWCSEKCVFNDIILYVFCDFNLNLEIGVYVGYYYIYGVDKVIYFIMFCLIILNFFIDVFFYVIYIIFFNCKRFSMQWSQRIYGVIFYLCIFVILLFVFVLGILFMLEYMYLFNI